MCLIMYTFYLACRNLAIWQGQHYNHFTVNTCENIRIPFGTHNVLQFRGLGDRNSPYNLDSAKQGRPLFSRC